ncbi:Kinesin-like protein KIF21A [Cucumispora dikerogammari]|nr:Kinesin-like protein KIF21A [Cucumispora dikerogammari]
MSPLRNLNTSVNINFNNSVLNQPDNLITHSGQNSETQIKVQIRVRPRPNPITKIYENTITVAEKTYTFNKVYGEQSTQQEIFEYSIKPLLVNFREGRNSTVFAYGQTGSGKTYTMGISLDKLGDFLKTKNDTEQGVVLKSLRWLFKDGHCSNTTENAHSYNVDNPHLNKIDSHHLNDPDKNINTISYKCTFFEIYNGECYDLLNSRTKLLLQTSSQSSSNCGCTCHHPKINTYRNSNNLCRSCVCSTNKNHLKNLKTFSVTSLSEAIEILKIACLERTTSNTLMNSHSSRSHAVLSLSSPTSTLTFIDLAGSERIKKTAVTGIGIKESISINSGLLSLGNVINALYRKLNYVPFRQDKLTRILQPFLEGESLTLMLACVSSDVSDVHETCNSLKYASRASNIIAVSLPPPAIPRTYTISSTVDKLIEKGASSNVFMSARGHTALSGKIYITTPSASLSTHSVNSLNTEIMKLRQENMDLKTQLIKCKADISLLEATVTELKKGKRLTGKRVTFKLLSPVKHGRFSTVSVTGAHLNYTSKIVNNSLNKNTNLNTDTPNNNKDRLCSQSSVLNKSLETNNRTREYIGKREDKENLLKLNTLSLNKEDHSNGNISEMKKLKKSLDSQIFFNNHKNTVTSLIKSPNLISTSFDGTIIEYSKKESQVLIQKDTPIFHALKINEKLYFSNKRQLLCKSDSESSDELIVEYKSIVTTFLFNKNFVFTGHHDGSLCCYDIISKSMIFENRKHKHSITNLLFSDNTVFSAGRDNQIIAFSQKEIVKLVPQHYDAISVLLSNDCVVLSAGKDCSIKLWDIKTKKLIKNYHYAHKSWIRAGCLKGDNFCTVSRDGMLKIWKFETELVLLEEREIFKDVNAIISYEGGFYISFDRGKVAFI